MAEVLVITMFLSDVINNTASAAVMCPIALGPGGFRFGDFWCLGIALELIAVLVAVAMLLVAAVTHRWFPPLQKGGQGGFSDARARTTLGEIPPGPPFQRGEQTQPVRTRPSLHPQP